MSIQMSYLAVEFTFGIGCSMGFLVTSSPYNSTKKKVSLS